MLRIQPSSLFVEGMASLVCGLQNGRSILPSPGYLTSWHSLLWWINQGLGPHFQACDYRSLFFLNILKMVSSLRVDAYYPGKWKCIESDSSLLICNKNRCQKDRNDLKSIKQEHVLLTARLGHKQKLTIDSAIALWTLLH